MIYYPDPQPVIVDIADLLPGIKQRVFWLNAIKITPQADGGVKVELGTIVRLYKATATDEYGEELTSGAFHARNVPLKTDDSTAVDSTGNLLFIALTETTVQDVATNQVLDIPFTSAGKSFIDWLQAKPEVVLLQNHFFAQVCNAVPVVIADLVRQNIAQAEAMGKYRL